MSNPQSPTIADDPRVSVVAEVLLAACEGPKAQMHPWRPFDFYDVARKVLAAADSATRVTVLTRDKPGYRG